jgi:hypothetical protein
MAKSQRPINHKFQFIDKDVERLVSVASGSEVLNAQVERDLLDKIEEFPKTSTFSICYKRSVGRYIKTAQHELINACKSE